MLYQYWNAVSVDSGGRTSLAGYRMKPVDVFTTALTIVLFHLAVHPSVSSQPLWANICEPHFNALFHLIHESPYDLITSIEVRLRKCGLSDLSPVEEPARQVLNRMLDKIPEDRPQIEHCGL